MDFFAVGAILVIYYIRPQDWVPGFAGTNVIQPIAIIGVAAVLLGRRTRLTARHFKTPHNWLMFLYGGYILFTAPDFNEALTGFIPLAVFYWVTLEALDSEWRITIYLRLWLAMLMTVAGLGVMSLYGFDLTGAVEMTEYFKGRLALGTWIHGNPNSLAHTVIVALPVCYFLMVWRSGIVKRLQAIPLLLMAGYCVYCAESRGAFVAGTILVAFALVLGRGRLVQVLVTLFLFSSVTALLSTLPRMNLDIRSDEGIQGRIMAWEIARTAARREMNGAGWKKFDAYISYEGETSKKATHSCYVRVAADLGYPGLFLYWAIMWCSLRSLFTLRSQSVEVERLRRVLLVMLAGYIISGWMIDRSYYVEYFLIAAVCAALHRLHNTKEESQTAIHCEAVPPQHESMAEIGQEPLSHDAGAAPLKMKRDLPWNRFGLLDCAVSVALTYATLRLWDYILETF